MRRHAIIRLTILASLIATGGFAQDAPNLVTSHHTQVSTNGYTQIDFTLRDIPEDGILSFAVRFEPRFV